jgi:circadian clock protein KaiC
MKQNGRVSIGTLKTGVPGLDLILGGGLPEYSFNLIAGEPGSGKTTLAHQIMFANAAAEGPALYFTVLGEPAIKMLRYQQQFDFFDSDKVGTEIRFVNLSERVMQGNLQEVLNEIFHEVERTAPRIVIVDSFRTVIRAAGSDHPEFALQDFLQRLALFLTSWQATTFLVGEYFEKDKTENPVFTVADGIFWLYQNVERNSSVRKLQVLKMRGSDPMPGMHTFRISRSGIQTFPRLLKPHGLFSSSAERRRLETGIRGLDEMLNGGIPEGDSVLVAGPAGSGKTVFAQQFVTYGIQNGEPGVMVTFEEHPLLYQYRAEQFGLDLKKMVADEKLSIIYLRPLDLSVDETLQEIQDTVRKIKAKRVSIDSLSGFELGLAPTFREDFRESLYRMVGSLTGLGVTVLMTVEVMTSFTNLEFTQHLVSFLTDEIILLRYIEIDGALKKMIAAVKMRGSQHSKELREFEITANGLVIGNPLKNYTGLITGIPRPLISREQTLPGLTDQEAAVFRVLVELRHATRVELLHRTELQKASLSRALNRLVSLNYAERNEENGETVYRVVTDKRQS